MRSLPIFQHLRMFILIYGGDSHVFLLLKAPCGLTNLYYTIDKLARLPMVGQIVVSFILYSLKI